VATLPFEVAWRLLGGENVVQAIGLRNVVQQGDLVESASRQECALVASSGSYKKMSAESLLLCPGFFPLSYLALRLIREYTPFVFHCCSAVKSSTGD